MGLILALSAAAALTLVNMGGAAAAAGESTGICGRIGANARPTSATAGSVTIGTRTLPIAPGVAFYPAAPISDPPTGAVMCLIGELGPVGQFISITAVNPFVTPYAQCGPVAAFRAAASTAPGEIVLIGDGTRRTLTIKAGTILPAESSSGYRCFTQELTAQGDLLVTGTQQLPAGFVTPAPAPGTLPSTSTSLDLEASSSSVVIGLVVLGLAGALLISSLRFFGSARRGRSAFWWVGRHGPPQNDPLPERNRAERRRRHP